jgi:hypothetical protein
MAYVPDWERLSDALKRVMASGVSEDEAKTDISRAISDRKIAVRVTIAEQSSDMAGTFSAANVRVPSHLTPDDFDWANSRPAKPWPTGPRDWISRERHSFSWRNRPISLIEVRTSDVTEWKEATLAKPSREATPVIDTAIQKSNVTAGQESAADERPHSVSDAAIEKSKITAGWQENAVAGRPRARRSPSRERAEVALRAVYPQGIPDQATEPNVSLCRRVGQHLKESRLPGVSDDTTLRAAGRRRK